MKINYQIEMEREIARIQRAGRRPRLLLHSCCAPCSSAVLEQLTKVFDITVFFYNPNIAPEEEFIHRVEEQERFIRQLPHEGTIKLIRGEYDAEAFYALARGLEDVPEGGERCTRCFLLRLSKTARLAAEQKFDYFTTTLSISPLKDAHRLNVIGNEMAMQFGVPYLFSDFKKKNGYRRSCELSAQYGLYRQDYCGCIYSKMERDRRQMKAATETEVCGGHAQEPDDAVSESGIAHWLSTQTLGRQTEVHAVIDSTNNRAKALAVQGAQHGTLVCARSQTQGRGRLGRKFHSPDADGIYMSLILRPKLPAQRAVMITSMTAVAVARAIERLADVQVQIKWVNDLYIGGKKVCGILCEAGVDVESGQLEYAVVGIGVNTARAEFPEELREIATSVGNVCGAEISKNRLIAEICRCMEELYGQLEDGAFMEESRARSNVIGQDVVVLRGDERFLARAVDIDDEGSLVVETAEGIQTVHSGEVSVRWQKTETME